MAGRVLITGSRGMLGQDLVLRLAEDFGESQVLAPSRSELDLTDHSQVFGFFSVNEPTLVINAAAYTNVDAAETDKEAARLVNAEAPALLAAACREFGARFVHFSTDQVFDGEGKKPRTEEETPHPLNWYAETKLSGERAALRYEKALVLRVQWLYGASKDRFTPLKDKKTFAPFADQFGAPFWTARLADVASKLLGRDAKGLFHVSYDDWASWAEVYQFVKEELGLKVELFPRMTSEANLPAKRPRFCVLSNRKLTQALGIKGMGSWKPPLADFLARSRLK